MTTAQTQPATVDGKASATARKTELEGAERVPRGRPLRLVLLARDRGENHDLEKHHENEEGEQSRHGRGHSLGVARLECLHSWADRATFA